MRLVSYEHKPNHVAETGFLANGVPAVAEHVSLRRQGAVGLADGSVRWRVWAPRANTVELVLIDSANRRVIPMIRDGEYFSYTQADVPEGQRYCYRLNGELEVADPCSLWQPDGVQGPSAVFRPERLEWADQDWQGVPRQQLAFYELHVGTFTPEGTFEAIIPRLGELKELGITAVEIMPVAQFPGNRNWGYDGVLPYAAQNTYGGPQGLHRLVDACHRVGLAVFLDVVYNHFGPEGNYLSHFGPYFTDHYKTPWGTAVNVDGAGCDAVRDFILDNARMWLQHFHFDGLRLDAVHAIYDLGARHILASIEQVAEQVGAQLGRPLHVIAESDLNDPRLILPAERGGCGLGGQWADDFHHAVHALLTEERQGYYDDFGERKHLASVMQNPYLYAWDYSPHRGRKHGAPLPPDLLGDRFVVCIQNHDQVGNRATGDRLAQLVPGPAGQRLAGSLLLLSPYLPLVFMGEEYGESNPFPFFCSFADPQLVESVRQGRRREFAAFAWQGEVPDPQAEQTFASARLSWSWPDGSPMAGLRRLYQDLLTARRRWPAMANFDRRPTRLLPDLHAGPVLELPRGQKGPATELRAYFNLGDQPAPLPRDASGGQRVLFSSESARYGGSRQELGEIAELMPHECVVFGPPDWPCLG